MFKNAGFTLIELMITIVIVGILAAVALPSYKNYVLRGKAVDATSVLANKRVQMEQYFQDNRTYVGAPACAADVATSKYFNFSCADATATTYTLQAVGKNDTEKSMAKFTYTINQDNVKTSTITEDGWESSSSCWVIKQGTGC